MASNIERREPLVELTFKPMTVNNLDKVLSIERSSFPTPWSRFAFLSELLQNRHAHYIAAWLADELVGYAGLWLILDEAHVTNIAVAPVHRGRGIGAAILREALARAASFGARRATLEVRKCNFVARSLYKKFGFSEHGIRKGYYSDTKEDAVIMWKVLDQE